MPAARIGSIEAISAKMGNSIDQSKALQKTYTPVNPAAVRAADEAPREGRTRLAEERNEYKKLKLGSREKLKLAGGNS